MVRPKYRVETFVNLCNLLKVVDLILSIILLGTHYLYGIGSGKMKIVKQLVRCYQI